MRVVQFINTLAASDGGPARNSFELNLALNRKPNVYADRFWVRGPLQTTVLTDHPPQLLPVPGPRRLRLRSDESRRDISITKALASLRNADIVLMHGYYLPWVPIAAVVCKVLRVPYVITPHGSLTSHQRGIAKTKKAIYEAISGRFVRKAGAGFITGSPTEAHELQERFPLSSVRIGGVGTSLAVSTVVKPASGRELRLLSVSRIAAKKRIDLMIDAVAALKARSIETTLTVAGTGDNSLMRDLESRARSLGVDDHVTFAGEMRGELKESLYSEADLFLLPSDDENFGIGLAEALAHGLPSIVSSKVAAAEAMTADAGVVLVAPTGESIANAVALYRDETRLIEARAAARACAERAFSWDQVAERWLTIFTETLRQR